jgi:hypothetical protein
MNNLATFLDNENCLKMTFAPSLYNYQSFNVCDLDNLMLIQFFSLLVYHLQNTLSLNIL